MLLLRALLLWFLICSHIVGCAVLFRRFFPRESPWFGFFIFPLVFVFFFNFVEHFVALPTLGWLLPFTTLGLLWSMYRPGYSWEGLKLPTAIFLVAFTFTFTIKCLRPDIGTNSEGLADLKRVLDFSFGDTLPPVDGWMPPYRYPWYYNLQHYGCSVVKRLFDVDIGTAYNICLPLLCAYTCLVGAGSSYLVSKGNKWVAWLMVFVIESTLTGSSPFIAILSNNPWLSINLNTDWDIHENNPLWPFLTPELDPTHEILKLFAPGTWNWMDEFHSNLLGHFLTLSCVLATCEILAPKRSNWPWIWLLFLPILTAISSSWVLIFIGLLSAGALIMAWIAGRRPESIPVVVGWCGVMGILLWPTTFIYSSWPVGLGLQWIPSVSHTPIWHFVIQWWPVAIPWLLVLCIWNRLDLKMRWFHIAVLVLFVIVESINMGGWRMLTVEKMWGPVYSIGLVTLLAVVFTQPGWVFRFFSGVILLASILSMGMWLNNTWVNLDWKRESLHLEGHTYVSENPIPQAMLQILERYHAKTFLCGTCGWSYDDSTALAVFSGNRCYIAWFTEENLSGRQDESLYRTQLNNDFYAGKLPDPLQFLEDNDISAVVIWPGNKIGDDVLGRIKNQIAPGYTYIDCKADGSDNAGIFVRRKSVHDLPHHAPAASPKATMPDDSAPYSIPSQS